MWASPLNFLMTSALKKSIDSPLHRYLATVLKGILNATDDVNTSWRICFIVPMVMHLAASLFIAMGQDLPDGSFKKLAMPRLELCSSVNLLDPQRGPCHCAHLPPWTPWRVTSSRAHYS